MAADRGQHILYAHMKKKVSDPGHPEPRLKCTQLTGELPIDCAG